MHDWNQLIICSLEGVDLCSALIDPMNQTYLRTQERVGTYNSTKQCSCISINSNKFILQIYKWCSIITSSLSICSPIHPSIHIEQPASPSHSSPCRPHLITNNTIPRWNICGEGPLWKRADACPVAPSIYPQTPKTQNENLIHTQNSSIENQSILSERRGSWGYTVHPSPHQTPSSNNQSNSSYRPMPQSYSKAEVLDA